MAVPMYASPFVVVGGNVNLASGAADNGVGVNVVVPP